MVSILRTDNVISFLRKQQDGPSSLVYHIVHNSPLLSQGFKESSMYEPNGDFIQALNFSTI